MTPEALHIVSSNAPLTPVDAPASLAHAAPLELAVIVPTLNESGNVDRIIAVLDDVLKGVVWEAIFVDDNSSDGTGDMLRTRARTDRRIRVIERIGRRGLASACIEGMMAASAPLVAVVDADLQHDLSLLPRMVAEFAKGDCDVVVGSRYAEGGDVGTWDATRAKGSQWATSLAQKATGVAISDPMSGFFMLESAKLRTMAPNLSGIGFKILLDILATSPEPLRVKELPYSFRLREEGESKLDRVVAFEYLVALYDRTFGNVLPTRFVLFGTIGGLGVLVHFAFLATLFRGFSASFVVAQAVATLVAMTFNFWLNNSLTYREQRLSGARQLITGWLSFCATCAVGAIANVALASWLKDDVGIWWAFAAFAGIVLGSVWNFALSSRFVWGRY